MEILYVLLNKTNRADFKNVYPSVIPEEGNRISLGAYREDGAVLGAVSYALTNYQYDIDWLYVTPGARRCGVARGLIQQIMKIISKTGERYPISARFAVSEEEHSLHRFFLALPDVELDHSHERYFVTAEDLRSVTMFQRKAENKLKTRAFFDEPFDWQERTLALLERTQEFSVMDYEAWKKDCVPELCKCLMVQKNLVSLIFVQKEKNDLSLSWLYGNYPPGLITLLGDALAEANRLYPKAALTFEAINENSEQLAKRLFPNARTTPIYEAWF